MLDEIARGFEAAAPPVDAWTLRLVSERANGLSVRQGVLEPAETRRGAGAMVTVLEGGGMGYGATCDLTPAGLARAAGEAREWARRTAGVSLVHPDQFPRFTHRGEYLHRGELGWDAWSLGQKVALLDRACENLKIHDHITDWQSFLLNRHQETLLVSGDGGRIRQSFTHLFAFLRAVANRGSETQSRTFGMEQYQLGGLEQLARLGLEEQGARVAGEALALLDAPPCPEGIMDLVLLPSQVVLQVHESIGHPLELDRILGDERNYAGTSFVTPDMFGRYRYGSDLLNVTFAPDVDGEAASYRFDDEGTPAERQYLIRDGLLVRPLGGALSQARAGLPGVGNSRAQSWNRPPIDRMANLNLEPGTQTLAQLIGSVERGVLMDTNRSWSIDDSRNKFQFGCELGRLIEDGELKGLVRTPGYRGISATFWRSLAGVGGPDTSEVLGLYGCGKGEPNQMIHVGHAAPPCRFTGVEVFGES